MISAANRAATYSALAAGALLLFTPGCGREDASESEASPAADAQTVATAPEQIPGPEEDPFGAAPAPAPTPDRPAAGTTIETSSGAIITVQDAGEGPAVAPGQDVTLRYAIFREGEEASLETSDRTGPLVIEEVGSRSTLAGLDEALTHLYIGSKARIAIPPGSGPSLAAASVPANETLVLEIEVVGAE